MWWGPIFPRGGGQYFRDEWDRIEAAGNGYPDDFAQLNSASKTFPLDGGKITQWFVPTTDAQDLEFARALISNAKDGILFLFFNPGAFVGPDKPAKQWTLLQNILARHHDQTRNDYDPNLYIRGVVNQEIAGLTTEDPGRTKKRPVLDPTEPANPVTVFSGAQQPPQRLRYDAMVPKNIKSRDAFHRAPALIGPSDRPRRRRVPRRGRAVASPARSPPGSGAAAPRRATR